MLLSVLQLILLIAAVIVEYYFIYAFFRSKMGKYPPYVPSRKGVADTILKEAALFLENSPVPMNITEPGCGDARILAAVAKHFPRHRFTGYEWDFIPYILAKIRTRRYKNIRILRQNFMHADYSADNLVILFTGNEIAADLSKILAAKLPDGAVIISECFKLIGLPCEKEISTGKKNYWFLPPKLYVYKISRPAA